MTAIDEGGLATKCVQSGIFCRVTPHYLMMAAKHLSPNLTDDVVGNKFGPYMFTQANWNSNCTGGDFDLDFDTTDVSDWTMQVTVFAAMARAEQNKLGMNAEGTSPTALQLFRAQMEAMGTPIPDNQVAQLTTDLNQALDDTRQAILTAAAGVLGPVQAPASAVPNADTPVGGDASGHGVAIVGPMEATAWQKYCIVLGTRESNNDYGNVNPYKFCGRWQFGAGALIDTGYVIAGKKNGDLPNSASWTGKDGVGSLDDWLNNHAAQDAAMIVYTKMHYNFLLHNGALTSASSLPRVAGLLAAAHLLGPGGAMKFVNGNDTDTDANGITAGIYYKLLSKAFGGSGTLEA